jgi:predicted GNAT family acetyltransferase
MNTEVVQYNNANSFLKDCEHFLAIKESFHNLKLGIASSIIENKIETTEPLYFGIKENNQLIGCALRSNIDRPLAITSLNFKSIEKLIHLLSNNKTTLHGIVGEIQTATQFRDQWISRNNQNFKLSIHLGVYEANAIKLPQLKGKIIVGTENEMDIIFEFVKGFCEDCFPDKEHTNENIQKLCDRHIKNKSLYLLKNEYGEIVSMAAYTRGSQNGGTVSLVYTPKKLRGLGYGSLVTALVSNKILSEKKFVSLFTDLTNPTSNSIYQKIGYKKIGENIHFDFV